LFQIANAAQNKISSKIIVKLKILCRQAYAVSVTQMTLSQVW